MLWALQRWPVSLCAEAHQVLLESELLLLKHTTRETTAGQQAQLLRFIQTSSWAPDDPLILPISAPDSL